MSVEKPKNLSKNEIIFDTDIADYISKIIQADGIDAVPTGSSSHHTS
jgi:hypothetical protein